MPVMQDMNLEYIDDVPGLSPALERVMDTFRERGPGDAAIVAGVFPSVVGSLVSQTMDNGACSRLSAEDDAVPLLSNSSLYALRDDLELAVMVGLVVGLHLERARVDESR